jgi:mRNA interferase MazF
MKRGEIWWINFDPSVGSEIKKTRPAVIISNNQANKYLSRIQVIPISSNTEKLYPSESLIFILDKKGKTMADQIMTVDKIRLVKKISIISDQELVELEQVLKIHLGLI